jgi:hypothetical protein
MIKRAIVIGAAGLVAIVLAVGGASEPVEAPEANVAECGSAASSTGSDPAVAGKESIVAGPVAVGAAPLARMTEANGGELYAKMGVEVSGHQFVVLSVPLALRNRVFLYVGRILDAEGTERKSLLAAPGYSETELQPCPGRARTLWRGGIRVHGRAPVYLLVTVEGRTESLRLPLGVPDA